MAEMQKLKEILEKLKQQIATFREKIPFPKKRVPRDDTPASTTETPSSPPTQDDTNLAKIYRDGTLLMRIGVFFVIIFGIIFLVSFTYFGKKIYHNWMASSHKTQLQKEYINQFGGLSTKKSEEASIIGLGKVIVGAYKPEGKGVISLEIWVRCDNPKTALLVQNIDLRLHDKVVDVLDLLASQEVDLISNAGKERAKREIIEAINREMQAGKILEVYFHNLVMQ